jgi:hypothetical protein
MDRRQMVLAYEFFQQKGIGLDCIMCFKNLALTQMILLMTHLPSDHQRDVHLEENHVWTMILQEMLTLFIKGTICQRFWTMSTIL